MSGELLCAIASIADVKSGGMNNNKVLLSICIPTFNRADVLDKSIASIVLQPEFESESVELVISDNASEDNTEEVVKRYQKKYKNISYSKNSENIYVKNFPIVIGKAHGIFRKLCNDTLIFRKGSIRELINIVKENIVKRPVIFCLNRLNRNRHRKLYVAGDFEAFIKIVSFYSTWIGGFGIWEDDFNAIKDKFAGCELSLWQTKVLFEICAVKNEYLVGNVQYFDIQNVEKKDLTYGLYKVFYENYLSLYQEYLITHKISNKTFLFLKKHLLFGFLLQYYINIQYGDYQIIPQDEDIVFNILNNYKSEKYFKLIKPGLQLLKIKKNIRNLLRKMSGK
jgi:glycosyltransferase involved in cell wall biosynthesis